MQAIGKGTELFNDMLCRLQVSEATYRRTIIENIVYTVVANQHLPATGTSETKTDAFINWICSTRQNYNVQIMATFLVANDPSCTSGLPSDMRLPGLDETPVPDDLPTVVVPLPASPSITQSAPDAAASPHQVGMGSDLNSSHSYPPLEILQDAACEAARAAGAVALLGFRGPLDIRSKGGTDIVTQFDDAAEKAALAVLQGHFPYHAYLAEESGKSSGTGGEQSLIWMVDPIDGTHNYANQLPFWCVSSRGRLSRR